MPTTRPLLSVCIPIYNPEHYFVAAVESILEQDFRDYELLIVDDCSTQPVAEVIEQFQDSRIRFVRNDANLGLPTNWNRCIELASGELITILHQDDVMLPGNLGQKVALLQQQPTVGLVYSDILRIDAGGAIIGGHWLPQPSEDFVAPGVELFRIIAETGNPIMCPAVMVRSECYHRVGMFDTSLPFNTDHHMWMRIALAYDIAYVARPLVAYRYHDTQASHRFIYTGRDYHEVLRSFDSIFGATLPPDYARHAAGAYRTLAAHAAGMCRWKLHEGKILPALRYASVYVKARARFRRQQPVC
jgi:glycosyltransferase involved in cell wall biosynthesis